MEGLKAQFPGVEIKYVPGTQFLRNEGKPVPEDLLTTPDGKPGLKAEYAEFGGLALGMAAPTPFTSRVERTLDLTEANLPSEAQGKKSLMVQWSGFLTPKETGDYQLGILADGFGQVTVEGKPVALEYMTSGAEARLGKVHLEKGQKVALHVTYGMSDGKPRAQLIWAPVNLAPWPEAVAAARGADLVIAVVGITSQLEGEEMPVSEEGFLGGDRTSLDLPKPEQALLEAVAGAGKPLVVVLMNGSALGVNWAKDHANAILEAWYSGEEGGAAVAETLAGKNNPAGRLPVTFYTDVSQLPKFEDYTMEERTYRYFSGKPLFPFGYGLSYSSFSYSGLALPTEPVKVGDPVHAEVTVTNNSQLAGDEVVQLYLSFPDIKGAPLKALRGFRRVHLEPGASQELQFELKGRDLGMVTDIGQPIIAAGEYKMRVGGGQPDTDAPGVSGGFRITGQIGLPE
jgi:beta-glucosidase